MPDLHDTASHRRDSQIASNDTDQTAASSEKAAFIHAISMVLFIAVSIFIGWLTSPAVPDSPTPAPSDLSQPVEPSKLPASAPK